MTKDYVPNTKKHFSVHCNELINKGITKYNKVIYIHDPFNILDQVFRETRGNKILINNKHYEYIKTYNKTSTKQWKQ